MIARLIRWSANNLLLIAVGVIFVTGFGIYAVKNVPLDAIPDLSDTQVIIYTDYPGQAPQVVEDQVTYPLSTAMLSVPKSRVVRGFSFFGVSFVYVIFQDGTDIYWARSRVIEYLSAAQRNLPTGVTPTLGPDATGVGWVYQYAVVAAKRTLAELRTTQDWQVRFAVAKAEGVAEVASVGGLACRPRILSSIGSRQSHCVQYCDAQFAGYPALGAFCPRRNPSHPSSDRGTDVGGAAQRAGLQSPHTRKPCDHLLLVERPTRRGPSR